MNEMTIYWITRLDGLKVLIAILTSCFLTVDVFYILYAYIECKKLQMKWVVACAVCGFVGLVLCILTPTTKEMALIKVVPPVVQAARASDVPERVCNALLKILEDKGSCGKGD